MLEAIYLIPSGLAVTFFILKKVIESQMKLFLQNRTCLSHSLHE